MKVIIMSIDLVKLVYIVNPWYNKVSNKQQGLK